MITPIEIKKKAANKYKAYLQSIVEGETFNPIVIIGDKKPNEDTVKFEEELMEDVFVAQHPQFNGAIGAALIASIRGN